MSRNSVENGVGYCVIGCAGTSRRVQDSRLAPDGDRVASALVWKRQGRQRMTVRREGELEIDADRESERGWGYVENADA
jgi:hypothetical protein